MRWLAIAILLVARSANAIVIMEPPLVRSCRDNISWATLEKCMAQHGFHMQVVKRVGEARLVRVDQPTGTVGQREELGFALYVERKGSVHLGGLFETGTAGWEALALETVTIHAYTGYRFDLGFIGPSQVTIDGETTLPAMMQAKRSVFCSGESWACAETIISCDVRMNGATYFTYRGTLLIDEQARVRNVGARTVAGTCEPPHEIFLGWPITSSK